MRMKKVRLVWVLLGMPPTFVSLILGFLCTVNIQFGSVIYFVNEFLMNTKNPVTPLLLLVRNH